MKPSHPIRFALAMVGVLLVLVPVPAVAHSDNAPRPPMPCCGVEALYRLAAPVAAGSAEASVAVVATAASTDSVAAVDTTAPVVDPFATGAATAGSAVAPESTGEAVAVAAGATSATASTESPVSSDAATADSPESASSADSSPSSSASEYVVEPGDTLNNIAQRFGVTTAALVRANNLRNSDMIYVGQHLVIPGGSAPKAAPAAEPAPAEQKRGSVFERQMATAKRSGPDSPFYHTTWVTFYGFPGEPRLGILGEYTIDQLVPRLRAQARAYAQINGDDMRVMPAFHLIYGVATKAAGADGSHLSYMTDDMVMEYIRRAGVEGFGVILDVQIGSLTPLEAIKPALPYLQYNNVQLALDPEFATDSPGESIGSATANQINLVQLAMSNYMQAQGIKGRRALIVHQFLSWMIVNKESLYRYQGIDLAICSDGFGAPWPKISKYNLFMDDTVQFTGFKLFYQWDEPLMSERQVLGIDAYPGIGYMEATPNLVVYQ